jgi:protein-tyrosine phosphatase
MSDAQHQREIVQVDLHSHILPGVDDGAPDLATALAMARLAAADGTRIIAATPHAHLCPVEAVAPAVAALNGAIQQAGIPLTVIPGREEQLTADLAERLVAGRALPLGESRAVLAELPNWRQWPADIVERARQVQAAGYQLILAHPERYDPVQADPAIVQPLVACGVLLEVNADSLLGANGPAAQATGEQLLRAGLAHLLASDAHGTGPRAPLLSPAFAHLATMLGPDRLQALRATAASLVVERPLARAEAAR